jgi:hypothetical protein
MKQPKSAIPAKRASKGPRGKRTPPQPRQYTVADLERARDRVQAAERRIDNDHTSNPDRGRAGLERAQLELHAIELQLRAVFWSDVSRSASSPIAIVLSSGE